MESKKVYNSLFGESKSGVVSQFGVQLKPAFNSSEVMNDVVEVGLRIVRHGIIWEGVEKEKGIYDFSRIDRIVEDCEKRGLCLIGCIAFANKLYGPVYTDVGRREYAKFAAVVAKRYVGKNIVWEIWNEPNVRTFWGKHGMHNSHQYADEYFDLVKETISEMRKAVPDCKIAVGAVSGVWWASYEWMGYIFEKGLLKLGADCLSIHPYSTRVPEDYVGAYARIRGLMVQAEEKGDFPIINTERGYPVEIPQGTFPEELLKEMNLKLNEAEFETEKIMFQARFAVRQYLIDCMLGCGLTIWYEWQGKEGFAMSPIGEKEYPPHRAVSVLCKTLEGFEYVQKIVSEAERHFILKFEKESSNEECFVLWCAPEEEKSELTNKKRRIKNLFANRKIKACFGMLGESINIADDNEIEISGSPMYVILEK